MDPQFRRRTIEWRMKRKAELRDELNQALKMQEFTLISKNIEPESIYWKGEYTYWSARAVYLRNQLIRYHERWSSYDDWSDEEMPISV